MQRRSGKRGKQSRAEGREAGRERGEVQTKSSNPALRVSATTKRGAEAQATEQGASSERWAWVEDCVWTEAMLAALGNGVSGGRLRRVMRESGRGANCVGTHQGMGASARAGTAS